MNMKWHKQTQDENLYFYKRNQLEVYCICVLDNAMGIFPEEYLSVFM